MAIKNEEINQTIVVVIKEASAEPAHRNTNRAQTNAVSDFSKQSVFVIVEQRVCLVGKVRHKNLQIAIAVEILRVHTHATACVAVRIKSDTGCEGDFGKASIAIVVIEEVCRGIISLKNIHPSVVVIVQRNDTQTFSLRVVDFLLYTYI